jgi:hypothetical protein
MVRELRMAEGDFAGKIGKTHADGRSLVPIACIDLGNASHPWSHN